MSALTSSASNNSFISQHHKIEIANRKMEEMRIKNEEILKRFEEVENDKKNYIQKFNDLDSQQDQQQQQQQLLIQNIDTNDLTGSPLFTFSTPNNTTRTNIFKRYQPIQDFSNHNLALQAAAAAAAAATTPANTNNQYQQLRNTFQPKQHHTHPQYTHQMQATTPPFYPFQQFQQQQQPQFDYQNYHQPQQNAYQPIQQAIYQQTQFVPNNDDSSTPRFRKKFQLQQNQVYPQQFHFNGQNQQQQQRFVSNNNSYRYNKQANRSKSGNFMTTKFNSDQNPIFPTFNNHNDTYSRPRFNTQNRQKYYEENCCSLEDYNLGSHSQEDEFEAYRLNTSRPQRYAYKSITVANGHRTTSSNNHQTPLNTLNNNVNAYRVSDATRPTPNLSNLTIKTNEEIQIKEDSSPNTSSGSDTNESSKESVESVVIEPDPSKVVDWAAEMDRICEETRKVLEQTQDIEQEIEKEQLDNDIVRLNGHKAIMVDTDGEDIEEDLNIYKVRVDDDLVVEESKQE